MAAVMIAWCLVTLAVRPETRTLPPLAPDLGKKVDRDGKPKINEVTKKQEDPLGWIAATPVGEELRPGRVHWLSWIGALGIVIAFGHSILAMSGEETLAQVYREVKAPKLRNFKRAAFIVFVYSLVITGLISFFAVMIIPDGVRPDFQDNLISGLAMNVVGPQWAKLGLNALVVVVGFLILAGAVNTSIVGANGVLNRVTDDGVLPDWFQRPQKDVRDDLAAADPDRGPPSRDDRPERRQRDRPGRGLRLRRGLEPGLQVPLDARAPLHGARPLPGLPRAAERPARPRRAARRAGADLPGPAGRGAGQPADQDRRDDLRDGVHRRRSSSLSPRRSVIASGRRRAGRARRRARPGTSTSSNSRSSRRATDPRGPGPERPYRKLVVGRHRPTTSRCSRPASSRPTRRPPRSWSWPPTRRGGRELRRPGAHRDRRRRRADRGSRRTRCWAGRTAS